MTSEVVMTLPLDKIVIPGGRRRVNSDTVQQLKNSISEIGLQYPITVRPYGSDRFILVAGTHRLEAMRMLDKTHIRAAISKFDRVDAELWEISENLHRAKLSRVERAEHIRRWRELMVERWRASKVAQVAPPVVNQQQGAQVGHPLNAQPHEHGVSKTAKALGITGSGTV